MRAEEAFEGLYRAHVRGLLGFALRRMPRPEDASDVVAETMLVAWRRLDQVPPGEEARYWLLAVARRVVANQRRGAWRRDRLGERLRGVLREVVEDHADAAITSVVLRQALETLPAVDREVLQLTTWEGLRPDEVAKVLEIPASTVRSRLQRARGRLGDALIAGGHPGGDGRLPVRLNEDER